MPNGKNAAQRQYQNPGKQDPKVGLLPGISQTLYLCRFIRSVRQFLTSDDRFITFSVYGIPKGKATVPASSSRPAAEEGFHQGRIKQDTGEAAEFGFGF